jgi:hypothetical protein
MRNVKVSLSTGETTIREMMEIEFRGEGRRQRILRLAVHFIQASTSINRVH